MPHAKHLNAKIEYRPKINRAHMLMREQSIYVRVCTKVHTNDIQKINFCVRIGCVCVCQVANELIGTLIV